MNRTSVDPRRWWALALLSVAQFIVILDTSIIGVALPSIQSGLGIAAENLHWIFNAYVIAFGGLLLLGGRLSDLFGRRRLFMTGFLILTGASLVAGLATSEAMLNAGRALQGLGAALIAPSALAVVIGLFGHNPHELGKALGVWGAAAAAGGTAGVFLGGVITEWLSWHWVFLINVPLGLGVLAFSPKLLRQGEVSRGEIDWLGALSITGAQVVLVYTLVTAEQAGWSSARTLLLFLAAAVLLGIFLLIQKTRREPLMPSRIFSVPNLSAANLVMGLLASAWIPLWFFLNLYLQQILGFGAFEGGLALLPMTLAIMVLMMTATERVMKRFGFKNTLVSGLLALGVSLVLFAAVPADGNFVVHVLPASLLAAIGMSLAYIPATVAGMSGTRPEDTGLASGIINTSYQIGSALGLAVMVAVAAAYSGAPEAAGGTRNLLDGFHAAFLGASLSVGVALFITLLAIKALRSTPVEASEPVPGKEGPNQGQRTLIEPIFNSNRE